MWRTAWLGGVAILLAVGLALVAGAGLPGRHAIVAAGPATKQIGILQGPIHTDILLPADRETRARFPFLAIPDDAGWLAVGWGSRAFYTSTGSYGDLRASVIWQAATGDESVMRFQPVWAGFEPAQRVNLSAAQLSKLRDVIAGQFAAEDVVGRNILAFGDRFYAADGQFNLLQNCNSWAGDTLRASGLRLGAWTPSTWSLRLSLALYQ